VEKIYGKFWGQSENFEVFAEGRETVFLKGIAP
jgi:hypothetical protein